MGADSSEEYFDSDDQKASPLRIDHVATPTGLSTSKEKLLRELKLVGEARTLEDVLKLSEIALNNLDELGVFRNVEGELLPGMSRQAGTCSLQVSADELAHYGFNVSSQVTLDARFVTQAYVKLRNLTGNCDHHSFVIQYGGHSRHDLGKEFAYKLRYARIYGFPLHSQLTLHQSNTDCRNESSYNQLTRGANFDLISSDGRHRLGYELSWLQLTDPSRQRASTAVRQHLGDHVRSALNYEYVTDSRVSSPHNLVRSGSAMRFHSMLAGLTPDKSRMQFARAQIDAQHVLPLSDSGSLVFDFAAGAIVPILGSLAERQETLISEHFHLGGPGSMRGFLFKGVGDREPRRATPAKEGEADTAPGSDAIGGDIFARLRASVNFLLPGQSLQRMGVHGHSFADTGSIALLSGSQPVNQSLESFWNQWRLSFGAGIKIPFMSRGYFELNYVQVLKKFGQDQATQGVQFGFAVEPYMPVPARFL